MIHTKNRLFTVHDLNLFTLTGLKLRGVELLDSHDPEIREAIGQFGYAYIRAVIEQNCFMYEITKQAERGYTFTPKEAIHFVSQDVSDKKSADPFEAFTQINSSGDFQGGDHANSYLTNSQTPELVSPPQKLLSQRRLHSQQKNTSGDLYQLKIAAGFSRKFSQPISPSPDQLIVAHITYCSIGLISAAIIVANDANHEQRREYYATQLANHNFKDQISIYDSQGALITNIA